MTTKAIKIYDDYIEHLNKQKSQRYVGKEEWFHSSSAGLCARKHYYSSIEKHPSSDKDVATMRLFILIYKMLLNGMQNKLVLEYL